MIAAPPAFTTTEIVIVLIVAGGIMALGAFVEWIKHRRTQ